MAKSHAEWRTGGTAKRAGARRPDKRSVSTPKEATEHFANPQEPWNKPTVHFVNPLTLGPGVNPRVDLS